MGRTLVTGTGSTDTVTVSAYSGIGGASTPEHASSRFDVADANALPAVTAKMVDRRPGEALDPQPTSVEEGDTVT